MVAYPGDWGERSIGDFVHVGRGASPRPIEAFLTSGVDGVNWIKIGDAPRYGKYITQTAEKITQSGAARSVRVNAGDFILSNSMSFGRPYILNIGGCIHDGWLRLYDYQDSVDKEFLYYVLSSEETKKQYVTFAAGSGVQNLNKAVVKKVVVHLPSIPEQKRIARAISEMDDHIDNLAELIEKKKAIRDGALEDLISGRTRLAGYTNGWRKTTIGACAEIFQGGTPSTTNSRFWGGNVIWVTPGEITRLPTMYIDDSERKITEEGVQNSSANLLPVGTILLCTRATIGDLAIAKNPMTTNQGFKNLVCNPGVDNIFFAYLLRTLKPTMLSLAIGTTFLEISKKNLSSIEISIPDYPEQKAIANVLTAMDDEIKALEDERDKMLQIREGAMDDLLTGRVRLTV